MPLGNIIFSFILAFIDSQRRWTEWVGDAGYDGMPSMLGISKAMDAGKNHIINHPGSIFSLPLTMICVIVSLLFDSQAHTLMQTETDATIELHLKNCRPRSTRGCLVPRILKHNISSFQKSLSFTVGSLYIKHWRLFEAERGHSQYQRMGLVVCARLPTQPSLHKVVIQCQ